MIAFFSMGGYAAFVWPSYALTSSSSCFEYRLGAARARARAPRGRRRLAGRAETP